MNEIKPPYLSIHIFNDIKNNTNYQTSLKLFLNVKKYSFLPDDKKLNVFSIFRAALEVFSS